LLLPPPPCRDELSQLRDKLEGELAKPPGKRREAAIRQRTIALKLMERRYLQVKWM
jgi:hypothetical protein